MQQYGEKQMEASVETTHVEAEPGQGTTCGNICACCWEEGRDRNNNHLVNPLLVAALQLWRQRMIETLCVCPLARCW